MNQGPSRYREVERLFEAALEHAPAKREAFLQQATDDSSLRAEVAALLGREARDEGLGLGGSRPEAVPERIGPFRILRRIGEGGFSNVFLAEQKEPIERQIALKVLRAGLDTEATLARFASERQALGLMNHDGIARIFDAGTTEQGRPWFAMEYVEGPTILDHARQEDLGTEARLQLVLELCAAVQHAHHKGLVHRDLKPGNILVSTVDGAARVKVIDFGIAKAMATSPDRPGATQVGQIIGTPEYMSPEQLADDPHDVDTRADIYALGVVLYELLAGSSPFPRDSMRNASFEDIRRLISDLEPPTPSTAARQAGPQARRRADRLEGPLDWVVLKAMAKDRERRYASPEALADDVRRFLAHEMVIARPPTVGYRWQTFRRRHRLALVVGGALTVALMGLAGGALWGWNQSLHRRAEVELALAETEAARDESQAVVDFLGDMLASPSPYEQGRDLTVLAMLDTTLAGLDVTLAGQEALASEVRFRVGKAYVDLGRVEDGEGALRRARDDLHALLGPDHERTLAVEAELADVRMVQDRIAEADSIYRALYPRYVALLGEDDPRTLQVLHQRGSAMVELSRYVEAESLLVQSWRGALRATAPNSQLALSFSSNLANLYAELGRYDEARPRLEEVLAQRIQSRGDSHPEVLETTNNLALLLADQGKFLESLPYLERASALQDELLGPGHFEALLIRNNLAFISSLVFRWDYAESLYAEGVELARAQHGRQTRIYQHFANNLGYLRLRQGNFAGASGPLGEVHALRQELYGREHRDTCTSVNNLAELALHEGRPAEAVRLHEENLSVRRSLLGDDHQHVLLSMVALGWALGEVGRGDAAAAQLLAARELADRTLDEDHKNRMSPAAMWARLQLVEDRGPLPDGFLAELRDRVEESLVEEDPLRAGVIGLQAWEAFRQGERSSATAHLAEARAALPRAFAAATPWPQLLADLDLQLR